MLCRQLGRTKFVASFSLISTQRVRMASTSYSAIIIGSGQSGTPLASAFANAGHKTALIESTHIGGTCINEGCTPTKTMVASARVAHVAAHAKDYGVELSGKPKTNMQTVRQRKRDIVDSFRHGSEKRLKSTENLDVYMGKARMLSPKEVEISEPESSEKKVVTADKIFVNVGCRPAPLDIKGASDVSILDSTSVMELDEVPNRLIVVGGGYVGLEFGQMFRRFGAEVVIVQRSGKLLPREDDDVSEAVKTILEEDGIEVRLNCTPTSISKNSSGGIVLETTTSAGNAAIEGSHILSAAGRIPNSDILSASDVGIEISKKGFINTNGQLETNVPGVYALGDVKGGLQFTHVSYDDFRVIRQNLIQQPSGSSPATPASIESRLAPYTVFIDPQLGRIGLSESEARALMKSQPGRKLRMAKMPFAYVARALEMNETRGFMKIIIDDTTKKILGATVLGIEGGEIMSMFQIAMMDGGLTYDRLQNGIFAHPNFSEALNNVWGLLEDIV